MDMWQDLASRSRATARKSDEDAARFRERVRKRGGYQETMCLSIA